MEHNVVTTTNAPSAIGPYSQAIVANGMVFTSGQLPIDPKTGKLVETDVKLSAKQALSNVQAILEECGSGLHCVVKTTVFLKDLNHFAAFNEEYATFFPKNPPARSCVQVAKLPLDAILEVECIALLRH